MFAKNQNKFQEGTGQLPLEFESVGLPMFLTSEEVEILTGTKVRKYQIEHLAKTQIPFVIDRKGTPVLIRECVIHLFSFHRPLKTSQKPSVNRKPFEG